VNDDHQDHEPGGYRELHAEVGYFNFPGQCRLPRLATVNAGSITQVAEFAWHSIAADPFSSPNQWDRIVNVEAPRDLKPGPPAEGDGIGAALREAVNDRFDRIPDEWGALLQRLERPRRAA
jgi:hypothetical protein